MSDTNLQTTFGPETLWVLNAVSGQTGGGYAVSLTTSAVVPDPAVVGSLNSAGPASVLGDFDRAFDSCEGSSQTSTAAVGVMMGTNVGNLLSESNVSWGWFQGGFAPAGTSSGHAVCRSTRENVGGNTGRDCIPSGARSRNSCSGTIDL